MSSTPAPAVAADSLIVGLDDMRRITGATNLKSDPGGDARQPGRPGSEPPGPCRILDPQVGFGNNWTQFRSVLYNSSATPPPTRTSASATPGSTTRAAEPPKPLTVIQTVGVYPYPAAAHATFEQLVLALAECSALHAENYDFAVNEPDASTVVLNYPGGQQDMYRVNSSVLIYVSVAGFPQSEQIANTVLQTITDRVT